MPGTDPVLPDRRSSRGGPSRVASQTSCLQCVWTGGGGVATPGSLFYADGSSGRQAHPWERGSHHCLCPSRAVALPAICNPGHRLAVPTSRHCNSAGGSGLAFGPCSCLRSLSPGLPHWEAGVKATSRFRCPGLLCSLSLTFFPYLLLRVLQFPWAHPHNLDRPEI